MIPVRASRLLAAVALVAAAPASYAQIYRCDTDSGVPLYQNAPGARCKPLDLPSITTIPAPARAPGAAPRPPQNGAAPAPGAAAPGGPSVPGASPASFPRVEAGTQRSRDQERRRILEDELRKEESRLAQLRTDFNGGEPERRGEERTMYWKYLERVQQMKDDIARSEGAVASLKRELSTLRD